MAVDALGHLLALHVTPAIADDRAQVEQLANAVQTVTADRVEIAFVDQGYTGEEAAAAAAPGPSDLRECVVEAVAELTSRCQAAERFGVSPASADRWQVSFALGLGRGQDRLAAIKKTASTNAINLRDTLQKRSSR